MIGIEEIRAAAAGIATVAVRTPLLPVGPDLWIKPENLQPVGAFKVRGALHALRSLPAGARSAGVVTHSSGNHGRALAYAGRVVSAPVVVVMPDGTPEIKVEATRNLGAEVIIVPPDQRETRAAEVAAARGLTIIPPYDHPDIIAGQGTVGLEIAEDLPDVEVVLVPVGGGGLASGVSTALKALVPGAAVFGVEPVLAADATDSLAHGELRTWTTEQRYRTVADGLRTPLSELTFAHLRAHLDGMITVTDEEILDTVPWLAREARIVAEPSGAVAPAGYRFRRDGVPAGRTVAVVSGGNIAPAHLARLLQGGSPY
jgi:threonine dehydratase